VEVDSKTIAGMFDVTVKTIRDWDTKGLPCVSRSLGTNGNVYNAKDCIKWWSDREISKRVVDNDDGDPIDIDKERARLVRAQANNEEIKEQTSRGELLPARMVIELCSAGVANCRNRVLSVHNKLRSEFPGLGDDVFERIESLHHDALTQLGNEGVPIGLAERLSVDLEKHTTTAETDVLTVG